MARLDEGCHVRIASPGIRIRTRQLFRLPEALVVHCLGPMESGLRILDVIFRVLRQRHSLQGWISIGRFVSYPGIHHAAPAHLLAFAQPRTNGLAPDPSAHRRRNPSRSQVIKRGLLSRQLLLCRTLRCLSFLKSRSLKVHRRERQRPHKPCSRQCEIIFCGSPLRYGQVNESRGVDGVSKELLAINPDYTH